MSNWYYIFGLQRSGTNFFEALVRNNYNIGKKNYRDVWKHSINTSRFYDPTTNTVVVHKKSVFMGWIHKFKKYGRLGENSEYVPRKRDNWTEISGRTGKFNLINLAKTYKHFHQTWVPDTPNKIVLRYEDMLGEKLDSTIETVESQFKWQKKTSGLIVPRREKLVNQVTTTKSAKNTIRDKYRKHYLLIR